jgi:hypothetical protein
MPEDYKKEMPSSPRGYLNFSLSSMDSSAQASSISLANQIPQDFGVWGQSPRSTILPKWFVIPPLFLHGSCLHAKEVTLKLPLCKSFVVLVGSLQLSFGVVPQPPCKGFDVEPLWSRASLHGLPTGEQGETLWRWWTLCHHTSPT